MNAVIRSLSVLLILVCGGCATSGGEVAPATGRVDFSQIVPGKTTKNEVRAMLGAPARAHQYRNEPGETWEYPYYGNYEFRIFWVEFRADGAVSKTEDTKDFNAKPYRGG